MATAVRKRGISIYRLADAAELEETDFMTWPGAAPEADRSDDGGQEESPGATGSDLKVLTRDAGGFSLIHAFFRGNFPLPRHSHSSDCMYYVISGSAIMGSQTLRAGDSFFVPCDAPYQYVSGPEGVEVLEIRHGVEQFDIKLLGPDVAAAVAAVADAAVANAELWSSQPVSPTFAANAG